MSPEEAHPFPPPASAAATSAAAPPGTAHPAAPEPESAHPAAAPPETAHPAAAEPESAQSPAVAPESAQSPAVAPESAQSPAVAPEPPPPGAVSRSGEPSPWPERLTALGASGLRWIGQPRVRLTAVGVLLLLIGGVIIGNSVWTLPLVVIGALMVVVAWIGRRLEGRFAVEWGESGTEVLFRATIKAPAQEAQLPAPAPVPRPAALAGPSPVADADADADPVRAGRREEVIEGEAHTIEIDVADLKALIAAVETAEARATETEPPAPDFRLRRSVHGVQASDAR